MCDHRYSTFDGAKAASHWISGRGWGDLRTHHTHASRHLSVLYFTDFILAEMLFINISATIFICAT